MLELRYFGILITVLSCTLLTDGNVSNIPFFREDYQYLSSQKAFYKFYDTPKTWQQAKDQCASEGSLLYFPDDENETKYVIAMKKRFYQIYVGLNVKNLTDSKSLYKTLDGVPYLGVYNKWANPNEPSCSEKCVIMLKNGYLQEHDCNSRFRFVCKKTLGSLLWDERCNGLDNDHKNIEQAYWREFIYVDGTDSLYKFSKKYMTWQQAQDKCTREGSSLFYPRDENEKRSVIEFLKKRESFEAIHMGEAMYDLWNTDENEKVTSNTYKRDYRQKCVKMGEDGEIGDVECYTKRLPFVCKKTLASLGWDHQCIDS